MLPWTLANWNLLGDQEAQGTLETLDFTGFIDFVNVGIFKADFTWVAFNFIRCM